MSRNSGRERPHFNLGVLIFTVIFIYMAVNIVIYLTRDHIAITEVESGRIVNSDTFTGFILRDEEAVNAEADGYVSYYIDDSERVAKGGNVCMISQLSGDSQGSGDSSAAEITAGDYSDIREQVISFSRNFSDSDYSEVYTLSYQVDNIFSRVVSRKNIDNISQSGSSAYKVMSAARSGIIAYTIDGMEGYSCKDISSNLFGGYSYDKTRLSAGSHVTRSEPAYKIIYGDSWDIVIMPSASQLEKFRNISSVNVKLIKDNVTSKATVNLFENGGDTFAALTLSNYMVRCCNDRYVEIEIIWEESDGLKIPSSAVVSKDFYVIPQKYVITDTTTYERGFYIYGSNGSEGPELVKPTIYLTTQDGYCYISLNNGYIGTDTTVMSLSDTEAPYIVGKTAPLEGVYNVNGGYAVFRIIEKLYEYGDYCIISADTAYGVSLYDHIILRGDSVTENQVIVDSR